MLRFLLFLFGLVLVIVGVLAGGCSLVFTPSLFGSGEFEGSGNLPIWAAGLAIAGIGIWGGTTVLRAATRARDAAHSAANPAPPPEATTQGTPPEDR